MLSKPLQMLVVLLWIAAGVGGALIARRKGSKPVIWGIVCFLFPPALISAAVWPAKKAEG